MHLNALILCYNKYYFRQRVSLVTVKRIRINFHEFVKCVNFDAF